MFGTRSVLVDNDSTTQPKVRLSVKGGLLFETASRNLIRGSIGMFTIAVLILLQSVFWIDTRSTWMWSIVLAVSLVAYFRPHNGILILAALTPLGPIAGSLLHSRVRVAEVLVLAVLAGALMRGWTLHRFRRFPSDRLQIAAVLFGFVVAASCIEQMWLLQVQNGFAVPFLQRAVAITSQHYAGSFDAYGMIFHAMLLLEGVALLVYAAHYCQSRADFAPQLVRMLIAGCVAAATANIFYFIDQLVDTGAPAANFREVLTSQRFSGIIRDVNAAGSFLVMGFFIALGRLTRQRAGRIAAVGAVFVIGIGLCLTKSRTAIVAALLIGIFLAIRGVWRSRTSLRVISVIVLLAGLSIPVVQYFPSRLSDSATVVGGIADRWMFLSTTIAMLQWQPLFGVGVGQYPLWSARFAPADLLQRQGPDNAHNNFAQVAGELGIAGLAAFASVLVLSLWTRGATRHRDPLAAPILAGLGAFVLTWLGGHPLLVPEVAFPFWITLAIVPGLLVASNQLSWKPVAAAALAGVMLALSVPLRIASKQEMLDFSGVDPVHRRQIHFTD